MRLNKFQEAHLQDSMTKGDLLKALFRLLMACFLLVSPIWIVSPAAAQGSSTITLGIPTTDSFPLIHFSFDGFDFEGAFLKDIKPEDVQVIEDGQARNAESLKEVQIGLQIIFAINTNPAMSSQVDGTSTYQRVQSSLLDWANTQPEPSVDDFSFSTATGLFVIRERSPKELVKSIAEYQPDLALAQPSLSSLAEALDLATDPLGRPGMKRAILYITPPLPTTHNATLTDLSDRARQIGVMIHVWQISSDSNAEPNSINPLRQLAELTHGHFNEIALNGPLPEIEPLFEPLRHGYEIEYQSSIQKSGLHQLSILLNQSGQEIPSNEISFDLTVQPPNPIFLSPPASITRSWTVPQKDQVSSLAPVEVPLQILIEFPDQHPRAIKTTRLYMDDQLIQENTTEPFDQFTWPIADLTTQSRPLLRVEVVDTLDLMGSSIVTPVDLTIDQPAAARLVDHTSGRGLIAIATVAVAGSGLILVLVLTNTQRKLRQSRSQFDKKRKKDPVTQPVFIQQDRTHPRKGIQTSWSVSLWPRTGNQNAPARLVALDESEQPITGGTIFLTRQEITFGTDPRRATQVIDSPTINELHARLYRNTDGNFFLADQGSIAGTWLNFAPVTASGARLEHGDLIHIGKVMFRFELTDPEPLPAAEIKVTHLEQ